MISLIFFCLAAICNAVMDTLVHHFGISVFQKLNPQFWWPEISWKNKYVDFDPAKGHKKLMIDSFSDGWHVFKTLMIVFICLSIVTYDFFNIPWWLMVIGYGTLWNIVFNLFYNHILIKKK